MAKSVLLITPKIAQPPTGGRAQLSDLQRKCLGEILRERLVVAEIAHRPVTGLYGAVSALSGGIDGINAEVQATILRQIAERDVGRVFIDGSNLGRLAKAIKRHNPAVEVFTFFHNVEARFFLGALKQSRSLRGLGILAANFAAERMAVRNSDRLIALNRRDSDGLKRLYGRAATDISPIFVEEPSRPPHEVGDRLVHNNYLLFVGGNFYANRSGILWFAREVSAHVPLLTCIVGRGLEDLRNDLELHANVRLIGEVDNLAPWYRHAKAVIAPIFDGSGMKTKVAEALMYGKRIVGTSEAFTGYEEIAAQVGWRCDSQKEFKTALRQIESAAIPEFDPELRLLYERHYSIAAAKVRLEAILG